MKRTDIDNTVRNIPTYDRDGNPLPVPNMESDDLIITGFTPLSFSILNAEDNVIGNFTLLATSKSKKLFTLSTNFLFQEEYELEITKELPFLDDNMFIGNKLAISSIINYLPSFLIDFSFDYNKDEENETKFSFNARRLTKEGAHEKLVFKCNSDIYSSMKFMEQYIYNTIINNHDIAMATIDGYNVKENPSDIFMVDRISRIVNMAPMFPEGSTSTSNIAIEFSIDHYDPESKEYTKATLLATFNIEDMEFSNKGSANKKELKSKFKGCTVDKIQNNFLVESDQYLQVFNTFDKLSNIDKEFLIIKGINKNKETKLFFIDSTVRGELQTLVENF